MYKWCITRIGVPDVTVDIILVNNDLLSKVFDGRALIELSVQTDTRRTVDDRRLEHIRLQEPNHCLISRTVISRTIDRIEMADYSLDADLFKEEVTRSSQSCRA